MKVIWSPTRSKNIRKQRLENINKRGIGNKTDIIQEIRQEKQEGLPQQTELVFGQDLMKGINSEDQPFTEEHDCEPICWSVPLFDDPYSFE